MNIRIYAVYKDGTHVSCFETSKEARNRTEEERYKYFEIMEEDMDLDCDCGNENISDKFLKEKAEEIHQEILEGEI